MLTAKKRAILYPYDLESFPLIRNLELVEKYELVDVISPAGWGFIGRNAGGIYGVETKLTVKNDFEEALENCEAVIFTGSYIELDYERLIKPKILAAIHGRKDVICTMKLSEMQVEEIRNQIGQKDLEFIYNYNISEIKKSDSQVIKDYSLKEPKAPVILVMGNGERANKFDIQLSLRRLFLKNNYKISQIGSKDYCELFGFHSFPQFMYNCNHDDVDKILLLNQYINLLDKREKPDVIIIGVPGGNMPYNEKFHNHFGLLNYMVSQAICPDFVIFSTLYEDYPMEYYEQIKVSVKYKLGYDINCFNLANTKINWESTMGKDSMQYISLDKPFITDKISKYQNNKIPIFNTLDDDSMLDMFEYTIDLLQKNSQAESV